MAAYSVADIGELPAEGPGGAVRKVRRALAAQAFGLNYFVFPPNHEGFEHDERESGHEEVFVCVRGGGRIRVAGDVVELRPGTFVRIGPEPRRCPVSGTRGWSSSSSARP